MHLLWWPVGLFALSVVVARWQFSEARSIVMFVWYQHWKFKTLRRYQRDFDLWLFKNHRRFWERKSRLMRPYHRLRHHERVWRVQAWIGSLWYKYAMLFVPTCSKHGWPFMGGRCFPCGMEEAQRKNRLQELAGKK